MTGVQTCALPIYTKWLAEMAGVTNDILKPAAMLLNYPVITSGEYAHRGSFKQLLGGNEDRKSVVEGKSVDLGGRRSIKKKKKKK